MHNDPSPSMTDDRRTIAREYETQKLVVRKVFDRNGHGRRHDEALTALRRIAQRLHAAEKAEGVPRGSTRRDIASGKLSRYSVEPSGSEYVLIDHAGAIPECPVYRTADHRKILDDCEKLNKAWALQSARIRTF